MDEMEMKIAEVEGRLGKARPRSAECQTEASTLKGAFDSRFQNTAGRQQLRERLLSRASQAQQESWRLNNLKRLMELLDKNPEVAEILELIEGLGL